MFLSNTYPLLSVFQQNYRPQMPLLKRLSVRLSTILVNTAHFFIENCRYCVPGPDLT